jgi:cyclophilin family peptidyl-prolyl cis-trans isomerase
MRTIRPTLRVVLTLLASCLGLATAPANAETIVRFSIGNTFFDVALSSDPALATTVNNFMNYVNTGRYTDTIIHRSTTYNPAGIQIIQGGSYVLDGSTINPIATDTPISLQAGVANVRGTIAMARTTDPNSATSGWFFNVTDNPGLDFNYAVFGAITDPAGLAVMDAIAALPVYDLSQQLGPAFSELPLINESSLVVFNGIAPVPEPSTLALAGVGLAAAAFTAARRTRRVAR